MDRIFAGVQIGRQWSSKIPLYAENPNVDSKKCHEIGAFVGGDEGARTPDPLLAKQVLYQLSYIPR